MSDDDWKLGLVFFGILISIIIIGIVALLGCVEVKENPEANHYWCTQTGGYVPLHIKDKDPPPPIPQKEYKPPDPVQNPLTSPAYWWYPGNMWNQPPGGHW